MYFLLPLTNIIASFSFFNFSCVFYKPEIVQKISILNINIDSVKTISKTDEMVYELGVYVRGLEQLNRLLLELDKQQYIYRVERLMR